VRREWRRRVARALGLTALAIAAVLLVVVAWLAVDALRAMAHLQAAARQVGVVEDAMLAGDEPRLDAAFASMRDHADAAIGATHGPHWSLAGRAPGLGPTVSAVQTISTVVSTLTTDALPALADAADVVDPAALAPQDGRVDLRPLQRARADVVAADDAVQLAAARLGEIDTEEVLGAVAGPVEELRATVLDAATTTATAARAVRLLPPMLGADGPRRYLLMVQSNAEIRSTGGFPGALVLLRVNDGEIAFEEQVASKFFQFEEPILPLTAEEEALYTERMAVTVYGTTITPDFPRAAQLASAMWTEQTGRPVDGVLSVDPVVLQRVLAVTGGVRTASGVELDGENAARVLLNEVYLTERDSALHDLFFADAARTVFEALIGGGVETAAVLPALATSAAEGRVLVWSAHQPEQDLLADTVLSGRLRGEDHGAPVVGVYLNDGSGAKISYYLDYSVHAETAACLPEGRREIDVTLDLESTAPEDAADLPPYVAGTAMRVPPGTARTNVAVYAPEGGWIEDARLDGEPVGVASYVHEGLNVALVTVDLEPGEATSLEVTVVTGAEQATPVQLRVTPGARASELRVFDSPCAG
jgi:hypothetical protein